MDPRTRWFYVVAFAIFAGSIAVAVARCEGAPSFDSGPPRGGPDEWLGFVYPDPAFLGRHEVVGAFPSLNECLRAVRAETAPGARHEGGVYECGVNCGDSDAAGTFTCERTVGNER